MMVVALQILPMKLLKLEAVTSDINESGVTKPTSGLSDVDVNAQVVESTFVFFFNTLYVPQVFIYFEEKRKYQIYRNAV